MQRHFTLEYWQENGRYTGRIKEIPGLWSEGKNLDDLEENIIRACRAMIAMETRAARNELHIKEIAFEVYYAPGPGDTGNVTGA